MAGLVIGDDFNVWYQDTVTVDDGNDGDDGEVTVQFNTAAAPVRDNGAVVTAVGTDDNATPTSPLVATRQRSVASRDG